jgi:cysteine desulfurase
VALDVGVLPVDLLSLTAHKLYGPKGIGALYVRRAARARLAPVSFGGGQEGGLRPGTLPTHQIVGFGMACELARYEGAAESERVGTLCDRLWRALEPLGGVYLNGAGAPRVAGILNVSFEGVEGESLVAALGTLAVSTGSACSSASAEPSYVLRALGRSTRLAESSLRLSLGRFTSGADIEQAAAAIAAAVMRLRRVSPACESTSALDAPRAAPDAAADDPLGTLARRLFETLPGAGVISDTAGTVLRGEAGGALADTWVRFHLLVAGDTVKDARFQAFGCPHTLAAAAWLTGELRGCRRGDLPGTPASWAQTLGVPVEKLGRLLVVEDAVRSALQQWP